MMVYFGIEEEGLCPYCKCIEEDCSCTDDMRPSDEIEEDY